MSAQCQDDYINRVPAATLKMRQRALCVGCNMDQNAFMSK